VGSHWSDALLLLLLLLLLRASTTQLSRQAQVSAIRYDYYYKYATGYRKLAAAAAAG